MVVCTMSKRQLIRIGGIAAAVLAVILIIVFAAAGSITASADEEKMPVCRVERGDNKVALTFDCAWDASGIDALLEALKAADTRATFFVTGEFCDEHSDAVRKISSAGHSVQNGSDKNTHIAGMNVNDLIEDTNEAAKKIRSITGEQPEFYRAPYCDYDPKALTTLEGMGYRPVGASADSGDLDDPDPDSVKRRVTEKAESGSIILFHNDAPVTAEALPSVITALKQKGLELVKLGDLLYADNYYIDGNGTQKYRPAASAVLPVVYSENDPALDSAFEKLRENLTIQQIYDLSSVGRVALIDDIKEILNEEELFAMREATYEELMECYAVLVYAAEKYGAGGAYASPQYDDLPQIVPPPPETTPSPAPQYDESAKK